MDNFYELPSTDELKELWDSDMDPGMQDVIRLNPGGDLTVEWTYADRELAAVVIHDRLMTDAALGTRPIKTEHSYSLQSDGDSLPDSPVSHHKVYEMEEECFPAISMDTACCETQSPKIEIKDEPFSDPESPHSSCPPSPEFMSTADLHLDHPSPNSLLATPCSLLTTPHALIATPRVHTPAILKLESGVALRLPPTPPSSSGSEDSEDNAALSRPPSPSTRRGAGKGAAGHTRQPIHTPLISSQPKGSTGTLILTAEEKRTLIAEGYPIPTRLPLTKAEEKSLKKIRRKIKNKISAQESRRKKKEYMDQLERKVELLASENCDYRKKIESLENANGGLMSQLQKLQAMVARTHPQVLKQIK